LVKRLETNVREDHEQEEMDLKLLMGEIRTLKQTSVKNEIRIERLEVVNKGLLNLVSKVLDKVANLNWDVIQVGWFELRINSSLLTLFLGLVYSVPNWGWFD
jgi:hypothetical protein